MSQIDVDALEHREVALEPGAGVDARRRERDQLAVGLGVELHEHEVPDLDVAVLVAVPGPPSGPYSGPRSQKISELGPHGPVSAMRQKLSSPRRWIRSGGTPDDVTPDLLGLVVGRRGP